MPQYKQAKAEKKQAKWQLDKLVIDKKVTSVPKDKVRDINIDVDEVAMSMTVKRCPPKTYSGSTFQGQKVLIKTQDDVIPALHAIYADSRSARATHNIYAYSVTSPDGTMIEHYEDDEEYGGGKEILAVMREHDITDMLICVTRWCGQRLLGKARFQYIREAASQIVAEQIWLSGQEETNTNF